MFSKRGRERKRPRYPSPARQWQGILAVAFFLGCIEVFAPSVTTASRAGGFLCLFILFVTYWSGLRAGMISFALLIAYFLNLYAEPGGFLVLSARNWMRIRSTSIQMPIYILIVGCVQGRLRNITNKEFDAREKAEAEELQRLSAEDDLRSSENMRRLVIDSALDAIVAMDEEGRITLWNRNAEALFGWTADEVMGRLLGETIVPPDMRETHANGLRRFLEMGEANVIGKRIELSAFTKDEKEFPVEISIAQHRTERGYVFVGFLRDLTEQKKLNERLRQAQKMEAIGTLAGGIAHDFNNILAAIAGNVALARHDTQHDDPAQENLLEIEKSVARATYVVRQILTFSRAAETTPHVIDVAATLQESVKLLRATLPASVEVEARFTDRPLFIVADTNDIHQIALNLGINAFQAMNNSSGKFELQAAEVNLDESAESSLLGLPPGRYVKISAGDNGCGMDAQTLSRVFEPFFTTKAPGEGTGLGLSVVYGIVSRNGGSLNAYSEQGRGTVFNIYFPAASAEFAPEEPPAVEPTIGTGERVLYVDDDDALVLMMTRMLRRLNYEVEGFEDAREALKEFQADPGRFDLVITDMSMPYIDGPELVQAIQAIRADIPIVMVTGYIRPDDLEQAGKLGIRELILKPNSVHEMGAALHRILQETRASRLSN